jgi:hypothetical protein
VANWYALNAIVSIFCNSKNPQGSCLVREAPLSNLTMIIVIDLLVIGVCGI